MEKIAVLRRNGLGDLLCAYPLVLYLQRERGAAVTLFVDKRNAPLIPYLPPVAEVVVLPPKGNKYWNALKTAWRYRGRFDVALSAKTSPMRLSNFFLFCLGAREQIAYLERGARSIWINHPVAYDKEVAATQHQALKGLKLVAPDMIEVPGELYPTLHIPEAIRAKYPPKQNLRHPIILLSATTTKEASRFDPARYAGLLNRLYEKKHFSVIIMGQKSDRERAEAIAEKLHMEHQVLFPRNFDEFMVSVDRADVVFVGDGGVAHIGAALGKWEVVLFGETDPLQWRPLTPRAEVFYHPENVNHLPDEPIYEALKQRLTKVEDCGRVNM